MCFGLWVFFPHLLTNHRNISVKNDDDPAKDNVANDKKWVGYSVSTNTSLMCSIGKSLILNLRKPGKPVFGYSTS